MCQLWMCGNWRSFPSKVPKALSVIQSARNICLPHKISIKLPPKIGWRSTSHSIWTHNITNRWSEESHDTALDLMIPTCVMCVQTKHDSCSLWNKPVNYQIMLHTQLYASLLFGFSHSRCIIWCELPRCSNAKNVVVLCLTKLWIVG